MKYSTIGTRTIEVAGYSATVNVKFHSYDNGKSYYVSVSETAKAMKAIAKAAGFDVLNCVSKSYSGGDSVSLRVRSELPLEIQQKNVEIRAKYDYNERCNIIPEPRAKLLSEIAGAFDAGKFDGMNDLYTYGDSSVQVLDPNGSPINIDAKYTFESFEDFNSYFLK